MGEAKAWGRLRETSEPHTCLSTMVGRQGVMLMSILAILTITTSADVMGVDTVVDEASYEVNAPEVLEQASSLLDSYNKKKAVMKAELKKQEAAKNDRLAHKAAKAQAGIQAMLAKAKKAQAQATALMGAGDDKVVAKAKAEAKKITDQAKKNVKDTVHKQVKAKMKAVKAFKAATQTKAAGKIAEAGAEANKLLLKAHTQEISAKRLTQKKADELDKKTTEKAATAAKNTATQQAELSKMKSQVDRRLAKAKKLEKEAADDKEAAKRETASQEKTFKVNKEYLQKEKQAAEEALKEAKQLQAKMGTAASTAFVQTTSTAVCKDHSPHCRAMAKDAATCATGKTAGGTLIHDECCACCSWFAWGLQKKKWTAAEWGESHDPPMKSAAFKTCDQFMVDGKPLAKAAGLALCKT